MKFQLYSASSRRFGVKQFWMLFLLVILFTNDADADASSKGDYGDRCIVDRLSTAHNRPLTSIISSCFIGDCSNPLHQPRRKYEGVLPIIFKTTGEWGNSPGASHEFENETINPCSAHRKFYRNCIKESITRANLTFSNGTMLHSDYFANDFDLSANLLPNIAFCDASDSTRKSFYEFMDGGGGECITEQENFLGMMRPCLLDGYFVHKHPYIPLILKCKNGPKLAQLYNDVIIKRLNEAYVWTFKGSSNSFGTNNLLNYSTLILFPLVLFTFQN